MSSFIAVVKSRNHWLLGGVKLHVSCRFETRQMALDFAQASIEINNGRAGYKDDAYLDRIVESKFEPEIFQTIDKG